MGGDDNEGSSIEKRVAPLSKLGRGEDGRGGDETGTGGGGARAMGAASAKEVLCGFSDNSSSDSDPGDITAAAGGGGGGGRANHSSVRYTNNLPWLPYLV